MDAARLVAASLLIALTAPLPVVAQLGTLGDDGYDAELQVGRTYNYENKFRGHVDESGYGRFRNSQGDTLRGHIDDDGYGRVRDNEGNTYRVKPR